MRRKREAMQKDKGIKEIKNKGKGKEKIKTRDRRRRHRNLTKENITIKTKIYTKGENGKQYKRPK